MSSADTSSSSLSAYFKSTETYQANTSSSPNQSSVAVVTGGRSGIGLALAQRIARFAFIDTVLCVSRSITQDDLRVGTKNDANHNKLQPLAADITTEQGRTSIVQAVEGTQKPLRFLVHSAGTIEPIKPITELQADELHQALLVNCQAPLLLTTALLPQMKKKQSTLVKPRVLHVSSGSAHGAPPVGWAAYGISKAAFFQACLALERELRPHGIVVGSFKPGVVDTSMQGRIRQASTAEMPVVQNFHNMKAKTEELAKSKEDASAAARPPPKGALDQPENVAHFAEFLLLGMSDEEFAHAGAANEYDIRDESLFARWIPSSSSSSS